MGTRTRRTRRFRLGAACGLVAGVAVALVGVSLSCRRGPTSLPGVDELPSRMPATHEARDDLRIPMRDGAELAADLWLPRSGERHSTVLIMTPYYRKLVGAALPNADVEADLPELDGLAFMMVDWRGLFGSRAAKGLGRVGVPQHGQDGYDVVEWIARQPWSDGNVAMWGPSANGKVQYAVAATQPPHLRCIAPIVASEGYSYEQFYTGGVLREGYAETIASAFGSQWMLKAHPARDEFWQKIASGTRNTDRIDLPVLLMTGWYDLDSSSIFGTFRDLLERGGARAKDGTRLVIGPWHHLSVGKRRTGELEFPEAEGVSSRETTRFLRDCLDGKASRPGRETARVRYFRMGENQWRSAERFPPPPGGERQLFLRAGGSLAAKPPESDERPSLFTHDPDAPSPTIGGMNAFVPSDPRYQAVGAGPRNLAGRFESSKSAVVFTTGPLEETLLLEGNAVLQLSVSSDQPDTDFVGQLCDVHPDGRCMLITDGVQRMRYRNGGRAAWMTPGQVYTVEIELIATAHAFLPGHRLRLIVSSASYPRFAVNPNVKREGLFGRRAVAHNQIWTTSAHPSSLRLPHWRETRPDPSAERRGERRTAR